MGIILSRPYQKEPRDGYARDAANQQRLAGDHCFFPCFQIFGDGDYQEDSISSSSRPPLLLNTHMSSAIWAREIGIQDPAPRPLRRTPTVRT